VAESITERQASPDDVAVSPGAVQSRSARWVSIGVGGVVIGLVLLLALSGRGEDDGQHPLLGQRAASVAGQTIAGDSFNLDDHLGSWVLVNFFATWCPGCINEHPELVELEAWGEESGRLELVSVVFNDPVDRVEEFFASEGGSWPVLVNPSVPIDYRVAQIPETFVVAPDGRIVYHVEGEVRAAEIAAVIEDGGG
jgi:cytochrome c biogenesis protein CcmG/thiol:disulfide interchange protein DsbE